jgi:hypothetical protein
MLWRAFQPVRESCNSDVADWVRLRGVGDFAISEQTGIAGDPGTQESETMTAVE